MSERIYRTCINCLGEIYEAERPEGAPESWLHKDKDRVVCPPTSATPNPLMALTGGSFQIRVKQWVEACFGEDIAKDRRERAHRFLEEALELIQACDISRVETEQLVEYVFSREAGSKAQEVGGSMTTLAALCSAEWIDMETAADIELLRCWDNIEKIRAKQKGKPKGSPLPQLTQHVPLLPEFCPDSPHEFKIHSWRWKGWPLARGARGATCEYCKATIGVGDETPDQADTDEPQGVYMISEDVRKVLEIILGSLNQINLARGVKADPPNGGLVAKARVLLRGVLGTSYTIQTKPITPGEDFTG